MVLLLTWIFLHERPELRFNGKQFVGIRLVSRLFRYPVFPSVNLLLINPVLVGSRVTDPNDFARGVGLERCLHVGQLLGLVLGLSKARGHVADQLLVVDVDVSVQILVLKSNAYPFLRR